MRNNDNVIMSDTDETDLLNSWGWIPGDRTIEEEYALRPTETLAFMYIRLKEQYNLPFALN
jgi:hypothetical protein